MRTQVEWKCLTVLSIVLHCQPLGSEQKPPLHAVPSALLMRGLQQMKKQPLTPMAEQDRPWDCRASHQPCNWSCAVPGLQRWVRSRVLSTCSPAQGRLPVTPAFRASSHHLPPSWGMFGSYINCASVNPIEKKGRIPFCPLSFVCALPLLLNSLFGVRFGEMPYYKFSALRKASKSLTRF